MHWLMGVWLVLIVGIAGFAAGAIMMDYEHLNRAPKVVTKIVVERVEVPVVRTEREVCSPGSTSNARRPHQYLERP